MESISATLFYSLISVTVSWVRIYKYDDAEIRAFGSTRLRFHGGSFSASIEMKTDAPESLESFENLKEYE